MNKLKIIIILVIASSCSLLANASDLKNIKLDLYTIEKSGKLSYVVGTKHIIPLNVIQEEIKEILISQEYLVVEHLSDDPSSGSDALLKEDDKNWWDELSANEQASLAVLGIKNVKNYKLDVVFFELIHWIGKELAQGKNTKNRDKARTLGFEEELEKFYVRENIFSLETADEMLPVLLKSQSLTSIKRFKNYLFIVEALQSRERETIIGLLRSKLNIGNHKTLNHAEVKSYDILTDDRNLLWIDRIENFHKTLDGKVLFAFGAAHLDSNQGILKLLEDRDFKITKLAFDSIASDKMDL